MTTSVQKKSIRLILTLLLLSFFSLNAATAREFTSNKSGTWSDPTIWTVDGGVNSASLIPNATDNVTVGLDHTVSVMLGPIACNRLIIMFDSPANSPNEFTKLDLNGFNLYVKFIELNGGSNNKKMAELDLDGGDAYVSGPESNLTKSGFNNISYGPTPITATNQGHIYFNAVPLPVELTAFKAVKKNAEVALTWETASEKNNAGFELQASTDGKNYEAVTFVASQNGNATSAQRYAYTHKTGNKEGLLYYRLKQVDMDGTFEYYNAKVVDLGRFSFTASAYPNPFADQVKVTLQTTAAEPASVIVTDLTGKVVYHTQYDLDKGANVLEISLPNQPAGLYLLKAATGNQTYVNRLVKQ